jgi:hypothetical protein
MEMNLDHEISDYMYKSIDKIIRECGPRMPCSPQEAKAASIISDELKDFCDEVNIEEFTCSPRAFLGWIRIVVSFVAASMILFLFLPFFQFELFNVFLIGISVLLNIISFVIMWKEFFNYEEFIDSLFKKKSSQNVVGKINSKNKKKMILIFSGHHDSALQFNLLYKLKIGYLIILFTGIIVMILWTFSSIIIFILELLSYLTLINSFYQIFFYITFVLLIIGLIPLVSLFNFVSPGQKANKVPGAVDNLSAVVVLLGIAKYLKNNQEVIPDDVEIRIISFGSEEAGLRGAYRYVDRHLDELKEFNTININMDAIQESNRISIIEYEPTTRTRHSKEVVDSLLLIGKKKNLNIDKFGAGGKEKILGQFTGGTDATAFSKAGIKASTISSMKLDGFLDFYHQPSDNLDKIEEGALENVLKVCLAYTHTFINIDKK